MTDFESRLKDYCLLVDSELEKILGRTNCEQQVLFDAMKYSVGAGGKRIRPVLLLEFCRVCGGDIKKALPFACAIEMIHTYSLIHDDLPCMDDDDMRRGKPSCHKAFGEANALLAGDALLNLAFETMLCAEGVNPELKIKAAQVIAKNSGADGMIGGQIIDLQNEGKDISEEILMRLYRDKTAALLRASAVSGAVIANANDDEIAAADLYANKIGIAFQIIDDILDCTADEKVLGKPVGSDQKNNKKTYVDFNGLEKAKQDAKRMTDDAVCALNIFNDNGFLVWLSQYLCDRNM